MSDFTLSLLRNLNYNFTVDENLTTKEFVVFRTKFHSSEEVHSFVREVEYFTNTNFRVRISKPNMQRILFRKQWQCKHSNYRKKPGSKMDTGCKSFIDIRIKKVNRHTQKNDRYLKIKEPLPCVMKINLKHAHSTEDEDFLKKLRIIPEIKKKFYQYFESGLSVSEARKVHESQLISCYDHSILSNAAVNPTDRQVYYLNDKWCEENFSPTSDPFGKPADITSISIRDLIPFINLKYQKSSSTDCLNENLLQKAKDVDCSNEEIKRNGLEEQLLIKKESKINSSETVSSQDEQITVINGPKEQLLIKEESEINSSEAVSSQEEQIAIMDCYSLSSESFSAETIPGTCSGINKENTDINLISHQKSLSVKEDFTFKYLLNNLSLIRKPNGFWGISSHSDVVICARWNENFICTKKVVIENSLILKVFLREWEINLSEFLNITCIEDICNALEKVENSIKCHELK